MKNKKDIRHQEIGGRKRASSRYAMIVHRTTRTETSRNKGYAGIKVVVTKDEFIEWFMEKDFPGCSVDRIDNRGDYELSNMQVISLAKNIGKDKSKHADGFCVCFVCKQKKSSDDFCLSRRNQTSGRSTICKSCDSKRIKNVSDVAHKKQLASMLTCYHNVVKR